MWVRAASGMPFRIVQRVAYGERLKPRRIWAIYAAIGYSHSGQPVRIECICIVQYLIWGKWCLTSPHTPATSRGRGLDHRPPDFMTSRTFGGAPLGAFSASTGDGMPQGCWFFYLSSGPSGLSCHPDASLQQRNVLTWRSSIGSDPAHPEPVSKFA